MLQITQWFLNGGRAKESLRTRISDTKTPVFSWAAQCDAAGSRQKDCRVTVSDGEKLYWDSQTVTQSTQSLLYCGLLLPPGVLLTLHIFITDTNGQQSEPFCAQFCVGVLAPEQLRGSFIGAGVPNRGRALYFRRDFTVREGLQSACLYTAGIGYQSIAINGSAPDDALLDPAFSNYEKTVYYTVHPQAAQLLVPGENTLAVTVADGWRNNCTPLLQQTFAERPVAFFGEPLLWAMLVLRYSDGATACVATDGDWQWSFGPITCASIYNGETYDARAQLPGWALPCFSARSDGFSPAVPMPSPCRTRRPMALEPIRAVRTVKPVDITCLRPGVFVIDFGENIAGVVRVRLPAGLPAGHKLVLTHAEELDEQGDLFTGPLRDALCTDAYIAAAGQPEFWQPRFTFHGFRYARLEGLPLVSPEDLCAVQLSTDIKNRSFFTCGSAVLSKLQENIVRTETDNLHSILSDCPQRDERMAWMNDATVRFEETPYNFDIGRIFPKIIRDIRDEQDETGAIACCCPRMYGERPADPVCSSYLVAGYQAWLHTGNEAVLRENFDGFAAWEQCLLTHSRNYIVQYSYYGDWAGPGYACEGGDEGARSAVTPGILMSTGYSYYNCVLLAKMARILGRGADAQTYDGLAAQIRQAFLAKWWHPQSAAVAGGSQGAQAFALWLQILPPESRPAAAKVLRDDLVRSGYRFTTGNLCTRYMVQMLLLYGYADEAYTLLTKEDYLSFGYMLQQQATTVWERFELKKTTGMNSHNHPMYGAVGSVFYSELCGITPTGAGYETVRIAPVFPTKLLSAQAVADTVKGPVSVRWLKRYGQLQLFVQIPFGVTAEIHFDDKIHTVGSGFYVFCRPLTQTEA